MNAKYVRTAQFLRWVIRTTLLCCSCEKTLSIYEFGGFCEHSVATFDKSFAGSMATVSVIRYVDTSGNFDRECCFKLKFYFEQKQNSISLLVVEIP